MEPEQKSDLLHTHLSTKFNVTEPNRTESIKPNFDKVGNSKDLCLVRVPASQLPLVFHSEGNSKTERFPRLRTFSNKTIQALLTQ